MTLSPFFSDATHCTRKRVGKDTSANEPQDRQVTPVQSVDPVFPANPGDVEDDGGAKCIDLVN